MVLKFIEMTSLLTGSLQSRGPFQNQRSGIMRNIHTILVNDDWTLDLSFDDGAERRFDVKPFLDYEAFEPLRDINVFKSIRNCGYFVEWIHEVDLSADTLYLDGVSITED
jgi:hypothetical protein